MLKREKRVIKFNSDKEDYNKSSLLLYERLKLDEENKAQLINKSKNADNYKDTSKGKNRYERRIKSKIAKSVAQYNKIDMDAFFKRDILTIGIEIQGETNQYIVTVRFKGVLDELQKEVKKNNNIMNFKTIYRAISLAFDTKDISVDCSCPDSKYRQRYWQWHNGYGTQYEPRKPKERNQGGASGPNVHDTKGAGCKHTLLVLSNRDWVMKVASVINNYIKYCQTHLQKNYATYIFPKIYGTSYNKAVQLNLFDTGLLPDDQQLLKQIASKNLSDKDEKGRWVKGNKYRFQSNNKKEKENPNQTKLEFGQDKELVSEDNIEKSN